MVIESFFPTATNARFALRDLRLLGLEPSDPIPVPPNAGRPGRIDVEPKEALAERDHEAELVAVTRVVLRHSGITGQ